MPHQALAIRGSHEISAFGPESKNLQILGISAIGGKLDVVGILRPTLLKSHQRGARNSSV